MKKVAYLGIPGSYSQLAAKKYVKNKAEYMGTTHVKDIFKLVTKGDVDYGIIPVENTLAGSVYDNYDLLASMPIYVVGECYLKIDLHLAGVVSEMTTVTRIKNMSKVVSHDKALEQSEIFLSSHTHIHQEIYSDSAAAAKFVADQKDPFLGAIVSRETAKQYKLSIIKKNIHDNEFNYTRYLIIAKENNELKNADKCSIIFTVRHEPGSLVNALKSISDAGLNLLKIESRPVYGKPSEYQFYADFMWSKKMTNMIPTILKSVKKSTRSLQVLGYYWGSSIKDAK